jgi:uncharacterized repeat protein (TIGR03803 family)
MDGEIVTLFNKRDYAAAERFWSSNYIQHSAHIEPGREGLFSLIKSLPPTLKYELGTIVAEGDFVSKAWRTARSPAWHLIRRGNLYGTTAFGGYSAEGVVFKLTPVRIGLVSRDSKLRARGVLHGKVSQLSLELLIRNLVTKGGECFDAAFQRKQVPPDRDGLLYLFHLSDCRNNRGMRLVSLFRSGPAKLGIQDYESRIENVRLNALRRAARTPSLIRTMSAAIQFTGWPNPEKRP